MEKSSKTEDFWFVKCSSCGTEFKVRALSREKALKKAGKEHDENVWACDYGAIFEEAFNLTRPEKSIVS